MRWLAEAGSFTCYRRDCEKPPGKECKTCGMPEPTREDQATLALYQRCAGRKSLPHAGGVLDQSETIMTMFDEIDAELAQIKREKQDAAEAAAVRRDLEGRLHAR